MLVLPSISFAIAWAGTAAMRRYALGSGLMDVPNERSSHSIPTPRGGGLAIVIAVCISTCGVWLMDSVHTSILAIVLIGGGFVALVGYLDDRHELPARLRFAVHLAAAVLAVALIDGGILGLGHGLGPTRVSVGFLAAIGVVWMLNLYNFMDGIDGIAAAQSAFMAGAGAVLNVAGGGPDGLTMVLVITATASCGFLIPNWPPATIFMGDVGSGFLGFLFGALALVCDAQTPVSVWSWIILGSLFIGDATATLLHRMARHERWYVAHRTHAYQWLARRFGRHLPVTRLYVGINVIVVFPVAYLSVQKPAIAPAIAVLCLLAVGGASLLVGAGRPESALGD